MYFLLIYDVVNDYVTARTPHRPVHLELARKAHERGDLVLAGAFGDPPEGAMLVFRGSEAAEAFAREDPYVKNGVATAWRVKPWNVVVGQA
jgi:hypothetical protein